MEKNIFHFEGILLKEDSSLAWNYRIAVPDAICHSILKLNTTKNARRIICTLNNEISFHAALMPDGNKGYYIVINKENRDKAKITKDKPISISIQPDESKYGIALAKEMEILLEQDEDGNRLFHQLTIGKQRSLLHIVFIQKTEQKRIEKGIIILEHLKNMNGKLDFKQLNEDFKQG